MKFINRGNNIDLNEVINTEMIDVVCLSNQPWDFELWTNKKQIMIRLRDRGHKVLFVDPPLRLSIIDKVLKHRIKLRSLFTSVSDTKSLSIYSPFRVTLNKGVSKYNKYLEFLPTLLQTLIINRFFSNSTNKKVLWVYHVAYPGLEQLIQKIKYDILIYDSVDEYAEMPQFEKEADKKWIIQRESWLLEKADIVFTSAPGLYTKFKQIKERTFYTPNAGSYELFSNLSNLNIPNDLEDIKNSGKKIIGFSGAIDSYKVDVNLVTKLADFYPDYEFVLIGPTKYTDASDQVDQLNGYNNIKFLGVKPYESLPAYFKYFDAYIIPYNLNSYTVGCFPTKFHDSLAAGLATITTNLQAFEPFTKVSYVAKSDEEFIRFVKLAIEENNNKKQQERMQVAKQNTWDQKVNKQLQIICSS